MSSQQLWAVTAVGTTDTLLSPTVSTGDEAIIDSIVAHNTSASTITVEWYLVPPAGATGLATRIHRSSIAADGLDFVDGLIARTIVAGATVYAKASAAGVNTAATGRIRQV